MKVGGDGHNVSDSASAAKRAEMAAKSLKIALEWCGSSSSGPLGEQVIWRLVLGVLQEVTRQQMIIGSNAWEWQQSAKAARSPPNVPPGQQRSYRVLEAARGSVEGNALLKMSALMFDDRLYYLLRNCDLINSLRVKAFIVLCKAGAGVHKHLSARHSQYPFRCFLRLDNPAFGNELNQDKPCSRDPWSARFYDRTGFSSDVALARLVLHAKLVYTENARCEVANANLRRFATRTQTHAISPQDLGVYWAGMQSSNGAVADDDAVCKAAENETGSARRRGASGGAWRAFVREQATNDLRRVGELYRCLGEDDRLRLLEAGKAATEANRAGTSDETCFGPKKRTITRHTSRRLAAARLQSLDEGVDTSLELERMLDVAVAAEYGPQATSRRLSALVRDVRRRGRERERADLAAAHQYAAEHTAAAVGDLVAAAPEIGKAADALEAVPVCSRFRALTVKPSAAVHDAYALKAWVSEMSARHNFGTAAERAWEAQHRLISSDELTTLPSDSESESGEDVVSPCWIANFCACSSRGKQVHRMRSAFLDVIKTTFPKSKPWIRDLLTDGMIVAHVSMTMPGWADEPTCTDLDSRPIVWHIDSMSYKPYEPYIHAMTSPLPEEIVLANPFGAELPVKARS